MSKQKTFGKLVDMEPTVPSKQHVDDTVIASDDKLIRFGDACLDCRGGVHSNDADQHDRNVEIVTEILESHDEWVTEYCTDGNYGDSYFGCLERPNYEARVEEWVSDNHPEWSDPTIKLLASRVCDDIDPSNDCEPEYMYNEYESYSGSGCCLDQFEIGEYENQVEINQCPELKHLHDSGVLDDILDDVNCDVYVHRSKRRVLNESTGKYEYVGRETYMPYTPYGRDNDYPTITTIHNPGGQWAYVISEERMKELVSEAIVTLASKAGRSK